jgi:hypothetical protein
MFYLHISFIKITYLNEHLLAIRLCSQRYRDIRGAISVAIYLVDRNVLYALRAWAEAQTSVKQFFIHTNQLDISKTEAETGDRNFDPLAA